MTDAHHACIQESLTIIYQRLYIISSWQIISREKQTNLRGKTAFESTPANLHYPLWAKQHLVHPLTCSHQLSMATESPATQLHHSLKKNNLDTTFLESLKQIKMVSCKWYGDLRQYIPFGKYLSGNILLANWLNEIKSCIKQRMFRAETVNQNSV